MNLIVCAPVALVGHERLKPMQRHQVAANAVPPRFVRGLVQPIYLGDDPAVALDFQHQAAHVRVLGPDLAQLGLGDGAEVGKRFLHGEILDIKPVFLHAPGNPSSAPDARHSSKKAGTAAQRAALKAAGRAPVKPGDHVGNDLGGDFDKQIAKEVFHGGSSLLVVDGSIVGSRPVSIPLVGFPGRRATTSNASRPLGRLALNTPTYCRETGLRIGVCPCPRCSKPQPQED